MPFQTATLEQSKTFTLTGQTSPLSAAFTVNVAAGSTLVVIGAAVSAGAVAALLGTVSGGGATWSAATNTRTSGAGAPNVFLAVGTNASAGAATLSLPFTVSGVAASDFKASFVITEIKNVPTTGVVDAVASPQTGTSYAATSTSTAATGTLAQTHNFILLAAGGWFGLPQNPSGYTSLMTQQNGTFIGTQISWRTVTSDASIIGTVGHEASAEASAVIVVLKAAALTSYKYVFEFAASDLPSAEGSIEALIARNVEPMSSGATYEYYSGLAADSGTKPGDATRRLLQVTAGLPADVTLGDTLRGSFRKSGGTTKGSVAWISGTVETA